MADALLFAASRVAELLHPAFAPKLPPAPKGFTVLGSGSVEAAHMPPAQTLA